MKKSYEISGERKREILEELAGRFPILENERGVYDSPGLEGWCRDLMHKVTWDEVDGKWVLTVTEKEDMEQKSLVSTFVPVNPVVVPTVGGATNEEEGKEDSINVEKEDLCSSIITTSSGGDAGSLASTPKKMEMQTQLEVEEEGASASESVVVDKSDGFVEEESVVGALCLDVMKSSEKSAVETTTEEMSASEKKNSSEK
eukprot:14579199-Ditylum_brightwellii.AAC.1